MQPGSATGCWLLFNSTPKHLGPVICISLCATPYRISLALNRSRQGCLIWPECGKPGIAIAHQQKRWLILRGTFYFVPKVQRDGKQSLRHIDGEIICGSSETLVKTKQPASILKQLSNSSWVAIRSYHTQTCPSPLLFCTMILHCYWWNHRRLCEHV